MTHVPLTLYLLTDSFVLIILTGRKVLNAIHAHLKQRHEHSGTYFSLTETTLKSDSISLGSQQFREVPPLPTFCPTITAMEALLFTVVDNRPWDGCCCSSYHTHVKEERHSLHIWSVLSFTEENSPKRTSADTFMSQL